MKRCHLKKKSFRNYWGSLKGHSGYYMVFMENCLDLIFKRLVARKRFIRIFIPLTYPIIYHYQKEKKSFFAVQKSLKLLKLLIVFLGFSLSFTSTGSSIDFLEIGS